MKSTPVSAMMVASALPPLLVGYLREVRNREAGVL